MSPPAVGINLVPQTALCLLLVRELGRNRRNSLQPIFTPVRVNCLGTQTVIVGLTDHTFKDDAWVFHVHHLSVLLVDDVVHASKHTVNSAAVRQHFAIEKKAAVAI